MGMPRPKPQHPLKPSAIRLTADDWAKFRERGGVAWLRRVIQRPIRKPVVIVPNPFKENQ